MSSATPSPLLASTIGPTSLDTQFPRSVTSFFLSRYSAAILVWTLIRSRMQDMVAPRHARRLPFRSSLPLRLLPLLCTIQRVVWLWVRIAQSDLGRSLGLTSFLETASWLTPSFPTWILAPPEHMSQDDVLFSAFMVNLFAVTVDMWVHANTQIVPYDMESIPSFVEWGIASYLHVTGADILVVNFFLTVESFILQCLSVFPSRPDKRYRLIPTTIIGMGMLIHFILRYDSPTYPLMFSVAKWPELVSVVVVFTLLTMYSLSSFINPNGMRQRPAAPTYDILPQLSDTYSPALFMLAGRLLSNPTRAPLRYETDPVYMAFVSPPTRASINPDEYRSRGNYFAQRGEFNRLRLLHPMQIEMDTNENINSENKLARTLGLLNHYLRSLGAGRFHEVCIYFGAQSIYGWLRKLQSVIGISNHVSNGPNSRVYDSTLEAELPDTICALSFSEDELDDDYHAHEHHSLGSDSSESDDDPAFPIAMESSATTSELSQYRVGMNEVYELHKSLYLPLSNVLPNGYLNSSQSQNDLRQSSLLVTSRDLNSPLFQGNANFSSLMIMNHQHDDNHSQALLYQSTFGLGHDGHINWGDANGTIPLKSPTFTELCVICASEPRNILLHPCGCLCLCDNCRKALANTETDKCPTCRRTISSYSKVYQP